MILKYILYSISLMFFSWIVGMIVTTILRQFKFYENISSLNLIKSKTLNKAIRLDNFKWVVKNTFFKYLNQKLKLKNKAGLDELNTLRNEMTFSEISHFVGFVFAFIFALVVVIQGKYVLGLIVFVMNIFMNLYPSLLQQENKRRIDIFIKRYS